jgi:broad specificity phosphatase PhoE
MKLYLITHARTQLERATAVAQWRLSDLGVQQAELLAQQPFWSSIQRIALSSEPKTRLTIEPLLAQHPLPVQVDARFDELRRPSWVEDYGARVQQAFAHPDEPAGEWEAAHWARQRFLVGIADLCHQFRGETVALVGHGLTLSLYRAYLLGKPRVDLDEWRQLSFAAVALVDPVAKRLIQDFQAVAGFAPRG